MPEAEKPLQSLKEPPRFTVHGRIGQSIHPGSGTLNSKSQNNTSLNVYVANGGSPLASPKKSSGISFEPITTRPIGGGAGSIGFVKVSGNSAKVASISSPEGSAPEPMGLVPEPMGLIPEPVDAPPVMKPLTTSKSTNSQTPQPVLASRTGSFGVVGAFEGRKKMLNQTKTVCLRGQDEDDDNNEDEENVTTDHTQRCQRGVIYPYGPARGCWDVVSLLMVMYDVVVMPLQLFDIPASTFSEVMTWTTRFFWTGDMPMSLLTGIVKTNGTIELRPHEIWKLYFKTWFGLDVVVVGVDWLEALIAVGGGAAIARFGKVSRVFRLIRMIRLLRLLRMKEVLFFLCERIQSERLIVVVDILKITGTLIFMAHLMGCFWYAVGGLSDGPSWIHISGYDELPIPNRYLMSLHWAISQFTGGMDEVVPAASNVSERIFAVTAFILSFLLASAFVSNLTSSMMQLFILGSSDSRQLSSLRRYLHQLKIPKGLAVRVQRAAQYGLMERRSNVAETNVELLKIVSEPLRVELHFEMFKTVLAVHPFFGPYIEQAPPVMRRVCHTAVSTMLFSHGDVIFHTCEVPKQPKMYIICSGSCMYDHHGGSRTQVGEGHWISEAALWTQWMHRGVLTASSNGRFCTVDAKLFQEIIGQFEHMDFDPTEYAAEFVSRLNQYDSEISDLLFCHSAMDGDEDDVSHVPALDVAGLRHRVQHVVDKVKARFGLADR